jgi:hypothetical protein
VANKHKQTFSVLGDQIDVPLLQEVLENLKDKMSKDLGNFHHEELEGSDKKEYCFTACIATKEYTLNDLNVGKHCLASSVQWCEFQFCGQFDFVEHMFRKARVFVFILNKNPTTFSRKSNALPVFSR